MTMQTSIALQAGAEVAPDVVYALAASPDFEHDGICFAGRASGLVRTSDRGVSWQPAYAGLNLAEDPSTSAVVVSPAYASDRSVFAGVTGAMLRSHDGGMTWLPSLLPSPPPVVSCLVASPDYERDGVLFAGTLEDGVFRSSDRGDHWVRWNFGLLDLHVLALALSPDFARDETLFAGVESGIFRSTNGGRAWREVPFPPELAPVICLAVSPDYSRDGVILAGTEEHGLRISRDRGRSWGALGLGVVGDTVNAILLASDFPQTPKALAVTSTGVFASDDGGSQWSELAIELPPDETVVAIAAPGGLRSNAPLLLGLSNGVVLQVG
jgi:photosystem II stability/assembly factor-like uncharacterized protein